MSEFYKGETVPFSFLTGRQLRSIDGGKGSDQLIFTDYAGNVFRMLHHGDCCECVEIEDICGDFSDVINETILLAEEVESGENPEGFVPDEYEPESFTWTFYKLSTIKGHVTIRWYGTSNGYYSESVSFEFVERLPSKLEKALK